MRPARYHLMSLAEKRRQTRPDHHLFRCERCGTRLLPHDVAAHAARCPNRPQK